MFLHKNIYIGPQCVSNHILKQSDNVRHSISSLTHPVDCITASLLITSSATGSNIVLLFLKNSRLNLVKNYCLLKIALVKVDKLHRVSDSNPTNG